MVEAQFRLMKCREACIWVEETHLGQGKLGFWSWEVGINQHARVGGLGPKNQKLSHGGLVSVNKMQEVVDLGSGNSFDAG